MRKHIKWIVYIVALGVALLMAVRLMDQFAYQRRMGDVFYASVIPGDPVSMGMRLDDVYSVLGKPDEETVMFDSYLVGFGGNNYVWRETGEVLLIYNVQILHQDARVRYSYYQDKTVKYVWAHVSGYETIPEVLAAREELVRQAEAAFEQKGDFTFELLGNRYSGLTYRFRAENRDHVFRYEVSSIGGGAFGVPYYINIYQSLY